MTPHRIYIEVVGLGERGHRYRVTYNGQTLIAAVAYRQARREGMGNHAAMDAAEASLRKQ